MSSNLVAAQGKLGFPHLDCSCSSLCNKPNERVKQRIAFKKVGEKVEVLFELLHVYKSFHLAKIRERAIQLIS